MQQNGVESLQSDRESLEEKMSLLVIGRDRSDFVAQQAAKTLQMQCTINKALKIKKLVRKSVCAITPQFACRKAQHPDSNCKIDEMREHFSFHRANVTLNSTNKQELKQGFCGQMPFLSPTSRNHSLDLIFSLTTKTTEQGRGVTPFTSALLN